MNHCAWGGGGGRMGPEHTECIRMQRSHLGRGRRGAKTAKGQWGFVPLYLFKIMKGKENKVLTGLNLQLFLPQDFKRNPTCGWPHGLLHIGYAQMKAASPCPVPSISKRPQDKPVGRSLSSRARHRAMLWSPAVTARTVSFYLFIWKGGTQRSSPPKHYKENLFQRLHRAWCNVLRKFCSHEAINDSEVLGVSGAKRYINIFFYVK